MTDTEQDNVKARLRERLHTARSALDEAYSQRAMIVAEIRATEPYCGSLPEVELLTELSAAEQTVRAAELNFAVEIRLGDRSCSDL